MKKKTLNVLFVLIIAIGGFYLVQPETAQAYFGEVCGPIEEDDDFCTECLEDEECEESTIDDCALLLDEIEEEFYLCDYES